MTWKTRIKIILGNHLDFGYVCQMVYDYKHNTHHRNHVWSSKSLKFENYVEPLVNYVMKTKYGVLPLHIRMKQKSEDKF